MLRRLEDLSWRATAVLDRVKLRRTLPATVANGRTRISSYVEMRDQTRIALDLYRPTRDGVLLEVGLPVVWIFDRYHRADVERGRLRTRLDKEYWLEALIRHGYVVAVADVRGSGASFGLRRELVTEQDRWDAYDITEWLAAQPWSNGRVGMVGKSFMGMTQFLAASAAPPHLAAICPERTLFDLYAFAHPGGVFRHDYARAWGAHLTELDRVTPAAPVDDDASGAERARAVEEHAENVDVEALFAALAFRDSVDHSGAMPYVDQSPSRHRAEVAASGIPVYQIAGWLDLWPRDALLWHRNLPNPRRLVIGPWAHTHDSGWKLFPDRLRWFDHWLKGVENGVMREPAIRYFTVGARRGTEWRSSNEWPLSAQRSTPFYFAAKSDGGLVLTAPIAADGGDEYRVDYSTTSGAGSRWANGYGRELRYPDMSGNDRKALTYTTPPLTEDLELTGHPVVSVWLTSTAGDADVFVYLEEVRRSGHSSYVTEGVLRASHRAEREPEHDNIGLPYHQSCERAVAHLSPTEPSLLRFDLHPVSRVFRRGRRLRVAITGADVDNASTPVLHPPPVLTIHRSVRHPSHISLPVILSTVAPAGHGDARV
ncbi:MAG: CocE/NonD family hydrolase [Gemmatimonadaceae bacterium]